MKSKFTAFIKRSPKYAVEGIKFVSIYIAVMLAMFVAGIFCSVFAYRIGLFRPIEALMDIAHKYMN